MTSLIRTQYPRFLLKVGEGEKAHFLQTVFRSIGSAKGQATYWKKHGAKNVEIYELLIDQDGPYLELV